jgi:rare lipoprotein A
MLERFSLVFVAVLSVPLLVGCGSASTTTSAKSPQTNHASVPGPTPTQGEERGEASFYSDRLAGRSTASGEPYDPKDLTAAHRTLPFGAVVRIWRPKNGRAVEVRINDRGPHKQGRIVDLSRRGAEEIGLVGDGVDDIVLTVVSLPPPKPKKKRKH